MSSWPISVGLSTRYYLFIYIQQLEKIVRLESLHDVRLIALELRQNRSKLTMTSKSTQKKKKKKKWIGMTQHVIEFQFDE